MSRAPPGVSSRTVPSISVIISPPSPPPLAILVLITLLGPFSLHILIPLLPAIAHEMRSDYAMAQLTATWFLFGISVAQLAYGPLSDRFGRRPVLLWGLGIYLAATAACLVAPSLEVLIPGRAIQAVGSCAGLVLGRAMVRDCYDRDRMASIIGYITMTMSVCSLVAPMVGSYIEMAWSWRATFAVLLVLGFVALIACRTALAETNRRLQPTLGTKILVRSYWKLLRSGRFGGYALTTAFSMAAWYVFIASMPYLLVAVFTRAAADYGLFLPFVLAGYIAGNFLAGRYSARIGSNALALTGIAISIAGVGGLWVWRALDPADIWSIVGPMTVVVLGNGMTLPNANAGAMSAHPEIAGAASGLLGFSQMATSGLVTWAVTACYDGTSVPILAAISLAIVLSGAMMVVAVRLERTPR